jgi:predicted nucleic acid-binding protein
VKPPVILDSSPLGLLCHPRKSAVSLACKRWLTSLTRIGRRVIVPEIADYEVRRELLRMNRTAALARLDALPTVCEYLPITTAAMHRAAQLWAQSRQQGRPTAGETAIDADVILAAQAQMLGVPEVIIATTNIGHLSRFVPADLWGNIAP